MGKEATMSTQATNLPLQLTSFVGRDREIGDIARLLKERSLLSLTGPGGTGKTRLALRAASQLRREYPDGVYYVELATVDDASLVLNAIANSLRVKEQANRSLLVAVQEFLQNRKLLLLLDNFEHVLEGAPLLVHLLTAAREVTILVTSRQPLRLSGEQEYPVAPLPLPDADSSHLLEKVAESDAVRLFAQRAQLAKPEFELREENVLAVSGICRVLDGLPLAIELAAARVKLFPPEILWRRMQDGKIGKDRRTTLNMLARGSRDMPARQQTLSATIEWSYKLLPLQEQKLFRRLAVFADGVTLEAAEAAGNWDGSLEFDILDGLDALLSKNLLRHGTFSADAPRFAMLQTIHDYASERLSESGEREEVFEYAARYYLEMAREAAAQMNGPQQAAWLRRLEVEQANLRTMLRWCEKGRHVKMALQLASGLWMSWYKRAQPSEGLRWLAAILAWPETEHYRALRAELLCAAGALSCQRGDFAAGQQYSEESLALVDRSEDPWSVVIALINLAVVARQQSDNAKALAYSEESLAAARACGDEALIAIALISIGVALRYQGQLSAAEEYSQECLTLARGVGDAWTIGVALSNLGSISRLQGDYGAARAYYEQVVEVARDNGDKWLLALAVPYLGVLAMVQDDYSRARALFRENLQIQREVGLKRETAITMANLAALDALEGKAVRAARMWGVAEKLRRQLGIILPRGDSERCERSIALAQQELGDERFAQAMAEGEGLSVEEAAAEVFDSVREPDASVALQSPTANQRPDHDLTPRELDVLRLVAQGLTDAQAAEMLVISPRTVSAHLTSIYSKLGVNSRTAASRLAVEKGWL